jgi:hypothetical protein
LHRTHGANLAYTQGPGKPASRRHPQTTATAQDANRKS